MNYMKPEIEAIEFLEVDVIQTSADPGNPETPKEPPKGDGNDLPIN